MVEHGGRDATRDVRLRIRNLRLSHPRGADSLAVTDGDVSPLQRAHAAAARVDDEAALALYEECLRSGTVGDDRSFAKLAAALLGPR